MLDAIKRAGQGLFDLLYPNVCLACVDNTTSRNGSLFCTQCHNQMAYTDHFDFPDNDMMSHFHGKVKIEKAAACFYFFDDGVLQKIIHNLKYRNFPEIGNQLGTMVGDLMFKHKFHENIDLMIPVPMHPNKQKRRGYNQVDLISDGIQEETNMPILRNILIKTVENESQTSKTKMQRVENTTSIYTVKNSSKIKDKHVLLVDDVMTTGSTLTSCADTLIKAGVSKVSIVCVATASRGF